MARYAIKAYEGIYQGLHGMYNIRVVETDNIYDAIDAAREESYSVMDSYDYLDEDLCESAAHICGLDLYDDNIWDNPEFINAYETERAENVAYEIFKLDDIASAMSVDDVENALYDNWDEFIEAHGIEI